MSFQPNEAEAPLLEILRYLVQGRAKIATTLAQIELRRRGEPLPTDLEIRALADGWSLLAQLGSPEEAAAARSIIRKAKRPAGQKLGGL